MTKIKILHISLILLFLIPSCSFIPGDEPDKGENSTVFTLSFDPSKSEKAVVQLIEDARESVYVALYGFDNVPIEEANIEAW